MAVMMAFGMCAMLGAAALAVDYAQALTARQFLSNAATAAALAAASRLPDIEAARETALEYVEKNLPREKYGTVLRAEDIDVGTWDSETRTFTSADGHDGGGGGGGGDIKPIYSLDGSPSVVPADSPTSSTLTDSASLSLSMTGSTSETTGSGGGGGGGASRGGGAVSAIRVNARMAESNDNGIATLFAWVLGENTLDVSANAVAGRAGVPCVIALDPTMAPAVRAKAKANLELIGCGVQVNSTSNGALALDNNSTLQATDICVGGTVDLGRSGDVSPEPREFCPGQPDPMATLTAPPVAGCDYHNAKYTDSNATLSPGTYCGGLEISKKSDVTLLPGTYVMRDGPLRVRSDSTLSGSEVTIFLTGRRWPLVLREQVVHQVDSATQRRVRRCPVFPGPGIRRHA